MGNAFDPYYKWLGIPPRDQSPNHYCLLGIDLFESDPDVIDAAASKQVTYLQTCATGPHVALSQKILNEVAAARLCLLSPMKKAEYDATLRAEIAKKQAASGPSPQQPDFLNALGISEFPSTLPPHQSRKKKQSWQIPIAIAAGAVLVIGIVGWLLSGGGDKKEIAQEAQGGGSEKVSATTQPPSPKPAPKAVETKPESKAEPPKSEPTSAEPAQVDRPSTTSVPSSTAPSEPSPASNESPEDGQPVNLLEKVELERDCVAGEWVKQGTAIAATKRVPYSRIMLPGEVEGDYDVLFTFIRHDGENGVTIILPVGWHRCYCGLGVWQNMVSGLALIDGKDADNADNPTKYVSTFTLANERQYEVLVKVRLQVEETTVDVSLNNSSIIHWIGNASSLSIPEGWDLPQPKRLGIGIQNGLATFHRAELRKRVPVASSSAIAKSKPTATDPPLRKSPIPSEDAQTEATNLIREVYAADYTNAKTSEKKLALAKKMIDKGVQSKEDAASRYVLFKTASDIAAQAGNSDTALQAIEQMDRVFQVDALALKAGALAKVAKAAKWPSKNKSLAEQAVRFIDHAVAADRFDVASEFCEIGLAAATNAKDSALLKQVQRRKEDVEEINQTAEEIQNAKKTLDEKPDDPAANSVVGKFLCFLKGEWYKGIPMLAHGNDSELRKVATKEVEGAKEAKGQAAIGDMWWDLGETKEGREAEA